MKKRDQDIIESATRLESLADTAKLYNLSRERVRQILKRNDLNINEIVESRWRSDIQTAQESGCETYQEVWAFLNVPSEILRSRCAKYSIVLKDNPFDYLRKKFEPGTIPEGTKWKIIERLYKTRDGKFLAVLGESLRKPEVGNPIYLRCECLGCNTKHVVQWGNIQNKNSSQCIKCGAKRNGQWGKFFYEENIEEALTLREKGLSQRAIGDRLGFHKSTIGKWLRKHSSQNSLNAAKSP